MILKITNQEENFYSYMGKFFGSRLVEKQTNDRIYDDDNKQWYLYVEDEKVKAFVSINKNIIKNIYTMKDEYLEEILRVILQENEITTSIVTNCYTEIYQKTGFKIIKQDYKNFVMICKEKGENKK